MADKAPQTMTSNGDKMSSPIPNTTYKPDGDQGFAQGGTAIAAPADAGVKTQRSGAPMPNLKGVKGGNHGGTVDTSPKPMKQGVPGIPQNPTIHNK